MPARREIADLRATTVARKAQQLEALVASRDLFPVDPDAVREAVEAGQIHSLGTFDIRLPSFDRLVAQARSRR